MKRVKRLTTSGGVIDTAAAAAAGPLLPPPKHQTPGEREFFHGMKLDADEAVLPLSRTDKAPRRQPLGLWMIAALVAVAAVAVSVVTRSPSGELSIGWPRRVGPAALVMLGGLVVLTVQAWHAASEPVLVIDVPRRRYREVRGPWPFRRSRRGSLDEAAAVRAWREDRAIGSEDTTRRSVAVVALTWRADFNDAGASRPAWEVGFRPNRPDLSGASPKDRPDDYARFVSAFAAGLAQKLSLPLRDEIEAERVLPVALPAGAGRSPWLDVPARAWTPPAGARITCVWRIDGVEFRLPAAHDWATVRKYLVRSAGFLALSLLFGVVLWGTVSEFARSAFGVTVPFPVLVMAFAVGCGLVLTWAVFHARDRWGAATLIVAGGRLTERRRLLGMSYTRLNLRADRVQRVHVEDQHVVLTLGWGDEDGPAAAAADDGAGQSLTYERARLADPQRHLGWDLKEPELRWLAEALRLALAVARADAGRRAARNEDHLTPDDAGAAGAKGAT